MAILFMLSLFFVLNEVNCKRLTREPKCGDTQQFRFDEELPTYQIGPNALSYCQYYRGETCCNKTHTDKIIKHVYAYHEPNVSTECRNAGVNVGCSPCDPRMGTNQIKGICTSYCNIWYDKCQNDFFHYNKRGLLTACSEKDLVCSKLSSIVDNGTQLCELSGYEVSYTAITCFDGKKSKFKPPPNDNQYQSPFIKLNNLIQSFLKSAPFQDTLIALSKLPWWQKFLVISGFAYFVFAIVNFLGNICSSIFGGNESKTSSSTDEAFSNTTEEIRDKRLQYLAKQHMISNQMNMEKKLAQQLGLTDDLESDNCDDHNHNHNHNGQELMTGNGNNNNNKAEQQQDISSSDDTDDDIE